jgi:anaerobic glycerol-3-phosphate dehydrogenase
MNAVKESLQAVRKQFGDYVYVAVDVIVSGAVLTAHAQEHCDELAEEIRQFSSLTAAKITHLGGADKTVVSEAARTVWAAIEREESTKEIAAALVNHAAKPEEMN